MTVKKKIDENDALRYAVISNGGSIKDDEPRSDEWQKISLRITKKMLKEMQCFLDRRTGLTRNAWILEAIQQKFGEDYDRGI